MSDAAEAVKSDSPWYLKNYKESLTKSGRIIPKVEVALAKKSADRNSTRDTQHLHPSELSKKLWCPRSSWYQITGAPKAAESFSLQRLNVFEEGHSIHHKWQQWLWDAGLLVGRWYCVDCESTWFAKSPSLCFSCGSTRLKYREVPLRDDEHRIIGHADGEIEDSRGRALIEIKSVGVGTVRFEKPSLFADYQIGKLTIDDVWKNIKSPFMSHIRQGQLYMHCRKVDSIVFIYEWKPTQAVKEFEVKYNADIVEPILAGCKTVMHHLELNVAPDKPAWATSRSCEGCKFCLFKKECYASDKP
jgi:hypothetical protein